MSASRHTSDSESSEISDIAQSLPTVVERFKIKVMDAQDRAFLLEVLSLTTPRFISAHLKRLVGGVV